MHSRFDHVGPGYFSTVGIPVLIGREIGPGDGGNGPRAAVINQSFARAYIPNASPVGKKLRDTYPGNPGEMEIVGVAGDAKSNSLRENTRPRIYVPFFNPLWEHSAATFDVRTSANPGTVADALRKAVRDTNSALEPIKIEAMSELVDDSLNTDRFIARLSGAFGLLAMLLATIGLYRVMGYTVLARTREIGVFMALAHPPGGFSGSSCVRRLSWWPQASDWARLWQSAESASSEAWCSAWDFWIRWPSRPQRSCCPPSRCSPASCRPDAPRASIPLSR